MGTQSALERSRSEPSARAVLLVVEYLTEEFLADKKDPRRIDFLRRVMDRAITETEGPVPIRGHVTAGDKAEALALLREMLPRLLAP